MKRTDKKGFTIVELVIVIAVIAILAAVLIPNISKLVRKANESSDLSLVRNLNTALSLETKDYATAHEAFEAVKEAGYDLTKIEAKADKNKILYDSENQCFAYLKDGKLEYYPNSAKTPVTSDNYYKLWAVCNNAGDIDTQFSVYWNGGNTNETLKVEDVGFDAGDCFVAGVEYTGTKQQTVTIRTNSGETNLTVNNDNATVNHYGSAGIVAVISVDASHSYHEFGSVNELTATKGHIVFETGSLILSVKKAESADVTFTSNGTVINANGIENITPATTFDISTLDQLCAFRDYVNAGVDFSSLPIEIKADIDMSSISWSPIGTGEHPFNGVIHGNGHTLKGLTNGSIISTKDSFTTTTTKTYGAAYGFIAIAGSITGENCVLEITDLNLSDVSIKMGQYGNCVGALIGYAPSTADFSDTEKFNNSNGKAVENITVKNVTVSGEVEGRATIGGVAGKLYNPGSVVFEDCSNHADVTATDLKAGGVIGYIFGKERLKENETYKAINITLKNLKNTGKVSANKDKIGGIVSYMNTFCVADNESTNLPETHILVENCVNTGDITGGAECAGVGGILYSFQGYKTGYNKTSSETTVTVKGCSNTGTLTNGKNANGVKVTPESTDFKTQVNVNN